MSEQARADIEEIARMGAWSWSLGSDTLTWSPGIYQLFGVDHARLPDYALYVSMIHPADRARVEDAVQSTARGGPPLDVEYRIVRPDGEVRVLHSRGKLLSGGDGAATEMTGTCIDVTERRQFEARMQVTDRLAAIGTLAGGIAHEINNPLGYVAGNLGFVMERLDELRARIEQAVPVAVATAFLDELRAVQIALGDARQGAERIRGIVHDVNRFARMDDDHTEAVRVHDAIEAAVRLAWNELKHRARLIRDYGEPPAVEGNPSRLCQVVLDLLMNAAQAIAEGKRDDNEIRIHTREATDGRAVIEIHDTGCGIRPELHKRIFDPFFTTKPIGTSTGIGLSVCHRIVTIMGGTLDVDSEVGRGSVFRISLPGTDAPPIEALASGGTGRRGRVLAIDDEPMLLTFYRRALAREHDVITVGSAGEALALFKAGESFDVVLCDLMMPQVTGWELHEQLAKERPDLLDRFVFITGGAFTPRGRQFLDGIPNQWIEKPAAPRQLLALIRSRLRA